MKKYLVHLIFWILPIKDMEIMMNNCIIHFNILYHRHIFLTIILGFRSIVQLQIIISWIAIQQTSGVSLKYHPSQSNSCPKNLSNKTKVACSTDINNESGDTLLNKSKHIETMYHCNKFFKRLTDKQHV